MTAVKSKAVVLLSGGQDSATCLAIAASRGFECYALSVNYGQRNIPELEAAKRVAAMLGAARHIVIDASLRQWGGSALTDDSVDVPQGASTEGIPATYVPARNLIFLSFATAWAEVLGARDVFIGVNAVDYSGYPDCREAFIDSFRQTANLATRAADEGWKIRIHTPLQTLSKAEIIRLGVELGVDYSQTVTCYNPDSAGAACGVCASCTLRKQGFAEAGVADPTRYR
jgi:7-cyano-7-deazaguanine synthase